MTEKQGICIVCEEAFTYEVKRGRQPKLCTSNECRSIHRKSTRKPATPVVRKQKCIGCDTIIVKHGRGNPKKRCLDCQKIRRRKQARDSAKRCYKDKVRSYKCATCKESFEQKGKGKLRKKCPTCLATTVQPEVVMSNEAKELWEAMG
jgi:hypothetical protein